MRPLRHSPLSDSHTMAPLPSFLKNITKRKKEKQDPLGSSSQPVSQSATRAPTPEPKLTSSTATDGSSKVDLAVTTPDAASNQAESAFPRHSVAKSTALNVFKLTLATLGKASNDVPVPGLKLAMEGLLSVIEKVEVCFYTYLTGVCFGRTRSPCRKHRITPKDFANYPSDWTISSRSSCKCSA
jgi:hypothetical protein